MPSDRAPNAGDKQREHAIRFRDQNDSGQINFFFVDLFVSCGHARFSQL